MLGTAADPGYTPLRWCALVCGLPAPSSPLPHHSSWAPSLSAAQLCSPCAPALPQIQDTRSCVACVGQQNVSEVIRRMDFAITSM